MKLTIVWFWYCYFVTVNQWSATPAPLCAWCLSLPCCHDAVLWSGVHNTDVCFSQFLWLGRPEPRGQQTWIMERAVFSLCASCAVWVQGRERANVCASSRVSLTVRAQIYYTRAPPFWPLSVLIKFWVCKHLPCSTGYPVSALEMGSRFPSVIGLHFGTTLLRVRCGGHLAKMPFWHPWSCPASPDIGGLREPAHSISVVLLLV